MNYEKAVRDKIPEIIRRKGENCEVRILPEREFLKAMEKKLIEEAKEYLQSSSLDELADILEVVYRISELRGSSREQLENLRERKLQEKGGFSNNLFLVRTRPN